ncbi:MAG: ral secretion pathway protein [Patescibacteria group bacterium]|nr:ral secretion pathway protein [Patescibacteria group bacterium]
MIRNNKKGFTLIELLVVISIIGLLSSVVLASLSSSRVKGRDAKRISDIRQLRNALELHRDALGYYPSTLSSLIPTYIKSISTDPSGAAGGVCRPNYCYSTNAVSNATGYHLGARMEGVSSVLNSDSDFDSSSGYYTGGVVGGFDGTETNIYDIRY